MRSMRLAFIRTLGRTLGGDHAGALLQNYQCRTTRIVAWVRAAFKQEALSSLLLMPDLAPVLSLPGDCMFQATGITVGHQTQLLCMPMREPRWVWKDLLPRLQLKGGFLWLLLAMLGTADKPPKLLDFAQSQAQPSTSRCCLPHFLGETAHALVLATVGSN